MPIKKKGRKGSRERGTTHAIKLRNERAGKPRPVDPEKLPDDAVNRRGRYQHELQARKTAAEAFVPWNQRGAKRDEHGRLVAQDDRDRKPTWLV